MNRHGSMNRIYRLVWSVSRGAWVAVAETARGRGKSGRSRLVGGAASGMLSLLVLGGVAQGAPGGGHVASGSATITQSGNVTDIRQTSQNLTIDWQSFNVGAQQTVDFLQPSASSVAVNEVLGTSGSQILGHLISNGQVWLINPNGVLFGQDAVVNVGGLVASTLAPGAGPSDVSAFSGAGTGSVVNQGTITAANGGYVALLGNQVGNQGTITAKLGSVALGAGSAATLTFSGSSLVKLQVDASTLNNLAANGGLIQADGGRVIMTAGAQSALLASVVNNTGVIEARTVASQNGTITLLGGMTAGTVEVGGTLDASAPGGGSGGYVNTSAAHVEVANGAVVTTLAPKGSTGTWLIDPTDFTVAASGGDITGATLSSDLNTTNFTILSSTGNSPVTGGGAGGNVNVNDTVTWSGNTTLTLTAANNVNINSSVTATGAAAKLVVNPNTANGSETASGTGVLNIGANVTIDLSGANAGLSIANRGYTLGAGSVIDLPNVSPTSTTAFRVGGASIRVINSLGTPGTTAATSLQGILNNLTGNYALGSNIDASATSGWNGGAGFTPIGTSTTPFTGAFDGLGHTITGLTINRPTSSDVGLFGYASSTSLIHNVGLVGGSVSGSSYVGALAGYTYGTVKNSYATGSVTGAGSGVGGLVGGLGAFYGSVSNSYAAGAVSGVNNVGGLVGFTRYGSISSSHASGAVTGTGSGVGGLLGYDYGANVGTSYATGTVSGGSYVGGLIGNAFSYGGPSISSSHATGNVTGTGSFVGGLVGTTNGTISGSFATGNVSGQAYVGGLVGSTYGGVSSSYATGKVSGTGTYVGGLVGAAVCGFYSCAPVSNSYATGAVSGGSYVGGLVGVAQASITNSYATGSVTSAGAYVGGLVGFITGSFFEPHVPSGVVSDSYATGAVTGASNVGGLVGSSACGGGGCVAVTTSYATGAVTGTTNVGGLIGSNYGTVANSYATGSVLGSGSVVGGLVGLNGAGGSVATSYSAGAVGGTASVVGGLVGSNAGTVGTSFWDVTTSGQAASAGGVGMTTAQMQNEANYTSATAANGNVNPAWDFGGTWVMYNGYTYPLLQTFMTPLTVTANGVSTTYNGAAFSGGTVSYSVVPNGNLLGTLSFGGSSQGAVNVGSYTITPGGLYSNQQGYIITYASGTLSIGQLASVAWVGGSSGNWSSASNWAGGAIPDYSNVGSVTIPAGVTVTYDSGVPGATTLNSLSSSGSLLMAAGSLSTLGNLSTNGYRQTGGMLNVGGTLSIASTSGGVTLGNVTAGTLNVSSQAGTITQLAATSVDVSGTTTLTAVSPGGTKYGISLADGSDTFVGTVAATGSTITLVDQAALTADVTSSGATSLTAAGALLVSGTVGTNLTTVTTGGAGSTTTFGTTTVGRNLVVNSTGAVTSTTPGILTVDGKKTTSRNTHVTVNGKKGVVIN